jgi:TatD DNase family protein
MMLVDVHAHLDIEGYETYGGIDNVIEECRKNHVVAIVANGVDIDSNRKILELHKKHSIVRCAFGIYPTHCLEYFEKDQKSKFFDELKFIEEQIKKKICMAIGEVGLEYKEIKDITEEQKNIQKECLGLFAELSKKYDIPIILHSRGAETEIVEFLESIGMRNHNVIMHCFSGRKHIVKKIIDNGWSFSIPCNLDRSEHFQSIVRDAPLNQLFTETDSPYLSPLPGKINRPDNVRLTIKKIAEIKKMTEEEVANIVYNNYQKMFL